MNVRAIALALPLVMGVAACKTGSTQSTRSGQTASTEERRGERGEATASTGMQTGTEATAQAGDLKAHASDEVVSGRLTKVSERSIAIESDRGEEKTLEVVPQTVVRIDGRDGRAADLQEGQEVRASFNSVEGREIAVEIRAGQDAGATMGSGSSGMMGAEGSMGAGHTAGTEGSMGTGHTAGTEGVKAHSSDETVSGKLKKVSADSIEIESAQGEAKTLHVVPETQVRIDGRDGRAADLQEGQEVRASFNSVGGRDVAVQIHAGQDAGMGSGSTGSTGTGMEHGSTGTTGESSTGTKTDPYAK